MKLNKSITLLAGLITALIILFLIGINPGKASPVSRSDASPNKTLMESLNSLFIETSTAFLMLIQTKNKIQ